MKKIFFWIVVSLVSVFIVIQFFQSEKTNPVVIESNSIESQTQLPANISSIFINACQDCHSNKTQWPWYSYIVPVSWLVTKDVYEGRKHLNFSEWGTYNTNKKIKKLSEIQESIADSSMPLPIYVTMHPKANLTKEEREQINQWTEEEYIRLTGGEEEE